MTDFSIQNDLSIEAFNKFLVGEIDRKVTADGQEQIIFKGHWNMNAFSEAIDYLKEHTGKGKDIDPFTITDGVAWILFANMLMKPQMNFKYNAVDVLKYYLDLCFDLQEKHNQRLHKGATLFWLSRAYYNLEQVDVAATYMIYAFVEDILYNGEPFTNAAYRELTTQFTTPTNYLRSLTDYTKANYATTKPFYPEEVLVSFELSNINKIEKIQGPR